jgi:GNAT superfamily N-acetyltransferase
MEIRKVSTTEILTTALLDAYAKECSLPEIGEINPQADMYSHMERMRVCQCFAAFVDRRIIGFASVLTSVLPHYGRKVATMESLFVAKEHRNSDAGKELMRAVEEYAKAERCNAILYSAPAGGQLERLLTIKRGYRHSNTVFVREL